MVRRSEQAKVTNEGHYWRVEYYEPRNASDTERQCNTQLYGNMKAMFFHAAYQLKTNAYNRIIFSYFKTQHVSEDTRVIGDQIVEWLVFNETERKEDTDSDVIDTSDRYSFSSDTDHAEAEKLKTASTKNQTISSGRKRFKRPLLPSLRNTIAPEPAILTSSNTTSTIIERTPNNVSTPPIPKKDLADRTALISDSHSPQPQFRIIQTGIQSIPTTRTDLTEKKYEKEKSGNSRPSVSNPASRPLNSEKTQSKQQDRSEQNNFRNLPRRAPDTRPSRVSSVIHRSQVLGPPPPTEQIVTQVLEPPPPTEQIVTQVLQPPPPMELTENMRHYSVPEGHDSTTRYFSTRDMKQNL
jgi:hypothetical protein